ncbi:hypothetical protein [uncultured Rubinisphaera sp.]|uniref:leucine-rich repeat domain-containing protein n=1 Tax=uncultured Rubinisphaera sp. TaxID=1678686 RepID=UPI0030DD7B0B
MRLLSIIFITGAMLGLRAMASEPTVDQAVAYFEGFDDASIKLDGKGVPFYLFIADRKISNNDLKHIAALPSLRQIKLMDCRVGDGIWKHLSEHKQLQELTLWGSQISDRSLGNLTSFPALASLDIRTTKIGDSGLQYIGKIKSLKTLELLGTRVTSKGMEHLSELSQLTELGLVQTRVGDDGLPPIGKLTELRELSLEGTRITNHGLKHLSNLTNLELLTIHNTDVTEAGLVHLGSLTKLETFYLCVPVSEQGLRTLKRMTALKHLYIGDVDPDPRAWLEENLPGVGAY